MKLLRVIGQPPALAGINLDRVQQKKWLECRLLLGLGEIIRGLKSIGRKLNQLSDTFYTDFHNCDAVFMRV